MKIIISRKGFDSSYGGCASPIFPDGQMLSLPIPADKSPLKYKDLLAVGGLPPAWQLAKDLTGRSNIENEGAHFDPDLIPSAYPRSSGWLPLFGQSDKALSHLKKNGVCDGDLFLFYGWFREVEKMTSGKFQFKRGAPNLHVLWGWLQIGDILEDNSKSPLWVRYHPHSSFINKKDNTLYVGRKTLSLGLNSHSLPGAGAFKKYDNPLCLTKPNETRSRWILPAWFNPWLDPSNPKPPLSYHGKKVAWGGSNTINTFLQSAYPGQEFILDTKDYPEAIDWAYQLISNNKHHT